MSFCNYAQLQVTTYKTRKQVPFQAMSKRVPWAKDLISYRVNDRLNTGY